jgi:hypothetical protein
MRYAKQQVARLARLSRSRESKRECARGGAGAVGRSRARGVGPKVIGSVAGDDYGGDIALHVGSGVWGDQVTLAHPTYLDR